MRAAIFSFVKVSDKSMVASVKVAKYVSESLQLPLYDNEQIVDAMPEVLILIGGAFAFCGALESLHDPIINAKRIVWIENDYSVVPPINNGQATSPFRRAFVIRHETGKPHLDFWSTCAKNASKTPLSSYINWNCLSMQKKPLKAYTKQDDLVYYGSYRAGRVRYFDAYFKDPKCNITISSPSKKFSKSYQNVKITHCGTAVDLLKWLSERGLGLYLEDRKSHAEYHSPPNRFYEMLSAGLAMVFPEETGPMLRKAGYNTEEFVIRAIGKNHILNMMERRTELASRQQELWLGRAVAERKNLGEAVTAAWSKLQEGI